MSQTKKFDIDRIMYRYRKRITFVEYSMKLEDLFDIYETRKEFFPKAIAIAEKLLTTEVIRDQDFRVEVRSIYVLLKDNLRVITVDRNYTPNTAPDELMKLCLRKAVELFYYAEGIDHR